MKLAFSTNAYTRFSLDIALRDIAAAGFGGVEILADTPHAYPDQIDAAFTDRIRNVLEDTGLAVSNVNANCSFGYWKDAPPEPYFEPSLISPNPQYRADRIRMIEKTLNFARDIGAQNISITSGRLLGGMPPQTAAKQFVESMKPVLDLAEDLAIDVGIECEPGLFVEYVAELREWIDRLDSPRLGANLDVGHCQVIGESIPHAVRLMNGRIWNLHVEDIPGRKHYHMIPGEGSLDWIGLRDSLRQIGYDRFASVELYTHTADPQTAARRSFEFLRKLFHEPTVAPLPRIYIYTKPGCHLCEAVEQLVARVRQSVSFELELRDITQYPSDFERYQTEIPVVTLNGREIARHRLSEQELRLALTSALHPRAAAL
jgi:fructoselysine 3-epimerase